MQNRYALEGLICSDRQKQVFSETNVALPPTIPTRSSYWRFKSTKKLVFQPESRFCKFTIRVGDFLPY